MREEVQKILLVDESPECFAAVEEALSGESIRVTQANSLCEAKKILENNLGCFFDLLLIDLNLPDGRGLSLLEDKDFEKFYKESPVFILTDDDDIESKVCAFGLGVDDYLMKPFSAAEFRARIKARLKKVRAQRQNVSILRRAELLLNVPLLRVLKFRDGVEREIELTSKEFKILYFLMRHEGQVFPRGALMREIWGEGVHVLERTVDSHVSGLRRKLGRAGRHLESVPGAGYRFFIITESASPPDR